MFYVADKEKGGTLKVDDFFKTAVTGNILHNYTVSLTNRTFISAYNIDVCSVII